MVSSVLSRKFCWRGPDVAVVQRDHLEQPRGVPLRPGEVIGECLHSATTLFGTKYAPHVAVCEKEDLGSRMSRKQLRKGDVHRHLTLR